MNEHHVDYQVLAFPRERQVIAKGGRLASRKHTIHGLIEVDVTNPHLCIRECKA